MGGLDLRLVNRIAVGVLAALALVGTAQAAPDPAAPVAWPNGTAVVTYESERAPAAALERHPATVVKRLRALRVVAVRPAGDVGAYAARLAAEPGIARVDRASARRSLAEPALALDASSFPFQWQYAAVGADRVPADVAAAAAGITIAVVDTGADVSAPDLASKVPVSHSVRSGGASVTDANGHGTFVAALAAGSSTNGDGIAGVAGEAGLMVVQAGNANGSFTDVDEAAAIVWAVDHGAKVVNLSLGGAGASPLEARAVDYAVSKGALLIAAAGNGFNRGNAVEYPAALLQPVGSRGVGGRGLAVAATGRDGARAAFSSTGTHISLAAPGVGVFSAVSTASPERRYPRTALPGSLGGLYGYGSGTSYAAPQVAGAAALVWAANPRLLATDVASILEATASGGGSWNAEVGFGVVDVAAAVERARTAEPGAPVFAPPRAPARLRVTATRAGARVTLRWAGVHGAQRYRVAAVTKGASRVLASAGKTGATYALARGTHTLSVTAIGPGGLVLAASAPLRVAIR
jgi:subtilisin family serine protease